MLPHALSHSISYHMTVDFRTSLTLANLGLPGQYSDGNRARVRRHDGVASVTRCMMNRSLRAAVLQLFQVAQRSFSCSMQLLGAEMQEHVQPSRGRCDTEECSYLKLGVRATRIEVS